ncbi:MAG: LLM class flavin-dependent oxidoreductase [Streptosporangiales bacterium]|nr:LLM class flavin-dependent oxidoreductase [Streptosporangiales bacterium]
MVGPDPDPVCQHRIGRYRIAIQTRATNLISAWIDGKGRRWTLRTAARYADVWNMPGPGESTAEFEDLCRVLDRHCADAGRDPAEIRRSIQLAVTDDHDELLATVETYARAGVTDFVLILRGADPVAQADRSAELLPRLRSVA